MDRKINVTVWNEYRHELQHEACKKAYPQGIHVAVGEALLEDGAFDRRQTNGSPTLQLKFRAKTARTNGWKP